MNNRLRTLFFLFLTCFSIGASAHNYHVSITQIDLNPETGSLEISMKLFTEDLEMALAKKNAPKLYIGESNEHEDAGKYIQEYIEQNFSLSVNGKNCNYRIIGKETEMEETWCYIEVKNVSGISELNIKNTIFTELFNDQTNRINVNAKGQEKSLVLSGTNKEGSIRFD